MFRGPEKDRPHLQNWGDANVDMGRSLMHLLVRSGIMAWLSTNKKKEHYYHTDLGIRQRSSCCGNGQRPWKYCSHAAAKKAGKTGKDAPAAATAADLAAMKKLLREQFELAEQKWTTWQAK